MVRDSKLGKGLFLFIEPGLQEIYFVRLRTWIVFKADTQFSFNKSLSDKMKKKHLV